MADELRRFEGPPEAFLAHMLAVQCRLSGASGAAILRAGRSGHLDVLALHPVGGEGSLVPAWLAQVAEHAGNNLPGSPAVWPLHAPDDLYGQQPRRHAIVLPVRAGEAVRGLAAYLLETHDARAVATARERLELTIGLLEVYELRLSLQRRQADLHRLRAAMETQAAVSQQDRALAAAMTACNEIAARWQCDRVSIGFLSGRYVRVKAVGGTEKFTRKMRLLQDIEAAMEECLDQDAEVVYPPPTSAGVVSRFAESLSRAHGPSAVASLPLRKAGDPVAVLTVERAPDRPFTPEELELLRLTCELCAPHLVHLHQNDRWFGARAAARGRRLLAAAVGPRHTWAKALAVAVLGLVLFLTLARGVYWADAPFVLEATGLQVIPAPFDGFLAEVHVRPDDRVEAGRTVLAELDTSELALQRAAAAAERASYLKQADTAMRDAKTAEAQIARANADKAAAQVDLLEHRLRQAQVTCPTDGVVLTGDLIKRVGGPVRLGETLFEVAPLGALRGELRVPEDRIADVQVGQEGELATVSYPDRRIRFVVERIDPVGEVVKQQNTFRVLVRLTETPSWMRPRMEGVARIHLGRRPYGWLWTRRLVNWVRMRLWV